MTTTSTTARTVDAETLQGWVRSAAGAGAAPMIVDVRSAAEYETVHIRGSYHVPARTLAEHTSELARRLGTDGTPVVLVCQSGVRAEQARRHLAAVGLDHAHVLDGGVPAYAAAGGEVVRGRRSWALERQVRLAAGSLVLAGMLAGRYLSPRARLLSGAIGTGLTVSALTDTCAMGAALARLPINRTTVDPSAADTLAALDGTPHGRRS
jgi:rhodanese-related sulfurtransferase